jgi:hypothetical protein
VAINFQTSGKQLAAILSNGGNQNGAEGIAALCMERRYEVFQTEFKDSASRHFLR